MKTFLKFILLLALCAGARAANQTVTATLTVSTNPHVGSVMSITGVAVTWTNNTGASAYWAQTTNSTLKATTNLYTVLAGLTFTNVNAVSYYGATQLLIQGIYNKPLTVTVSGPGGTNWASISYSTNTSASSYGLSLPFYTGNITNRHTNIFSDVVDLLNYPNGSNGPSMYAPLWTNFIDARRFSNPAVSNLSVYGGTVVPGNFLARTGALVGVSSSNMMATNLTGSATNLTALGGTNVNAVITNAVSVNTTNLSADTAALRGGTGTNMTHTGSTYSGTVGTLTGGAATNLWQTNIPSILATNITVKGKFTATNAVIDGLTVTNLSAPGSGAESLQVGSFAGASGGQSIALGVSAAASANSALAIGYQAIANAAQSMAFGQDAQSTAFSAIAVGVGSSASANNAMALGYGASGGFSNSVAIGSSASTTTTNQIRLGTATETISSPGIFDSNTYSNNTFRGTNQFNGEVVHLPRTYSTAISGYASAIQLGTNSYVRVTGASAAVTNASFKGGYSGLRVLVEFVNPGLSMTLLYQSAIGAPAATEKINTGTGALANSTNNPAWFELMHNGTEWNLLWIR